MYCIYYSALHMFSHLVKGIHQPVQKKSSKTFIYGKSCQAVLTVAGCANIWALISQLMCLTIDWTWSHYWPLHWTKVNLSLKSSWRRRGGGGTGYILTLQTRDITWIVWSYWKTGNLHNFYAASKDIFSDIQSSSLFQMKLSCSKAKCVLFPL